MRISLRNIGLIEKADVDINGITVIAGKNNTGKSTVAKSLYSVFKAFYNIDDKMEKARIKNMDSTYTQMRNRIAHTRMRSLVQNHLKENNHIQLYEIIRTIDYFFADETEQNILRSK